MEEGCRQDRQQQPRTDDDGGGGDGVVAVAAAIATKDDVVDACDGAVAKQGLQDDGGGDVASLRCPTLQLTQYYCCLYHVVVCLVCYLLLLLLLVAADDETRTALQPKLMQQLHSWDETQR